jgi:hypothetical protein
MRRKVMKDNYTKEEVQLLIDSIKLVRGCIIDGCPSGFNPLEGDWADRLFLSQGVTYDALRQIGEYND